MIRYRLITSDKNTIVMDYFKSYIIYFPIRYKRFVFPSQREIKNGGQVPVHFIVLCPELKATCQEKKKQKVIIRRTKTKGRGQWSIVMSISLLSVKIILRKASPKGKAHKNQKRNLVIFYNYHTQKVHMQKIEEHILIR